MVLLEHANHRYVVNSSRIALSAPAQELLNQGDLHEIYLGVAGIAS